MEGEIGQEWGLIDRPGQGRCHAARWATSPSRWKGGSVRLQPGRKVGRAPEIQQRFRQRLQLLQRQRLDPGSGGLAERATAAVELAEGHGCLPLLNAFLPAFLPSLAKDLLVGHALRELTGGDAAHGNALANTLNGAAGADRLIGGGGNDRLIGGLGNDTLSGGLGADIFRFDAALSSTTNRNTITDFNAAQGDRIQLENAVFTALTRTGTLAATAFRSGTSFTAAAQRILYNPATGNLSYDSNGSAAGGINALIATLSTRRALTSSMLVVT